MCKNCATQFPLALNLELSALSSHSWAKNSTSPPYQLRYSNQDESDPVGKNKCLFIIETYLLFIIFSSYIEYNSLDQGGQLTDRKGCVQHIFSVSFGQAGTNFSVFFGELHSSWVNIHFSYWVWIIINQIKMILKSVFICNPEEKFLFSRMFQLSHFGGNLIH